MPKKKITAPNFPGFSPSSTDFERVLDGTRRPFSVALIDLTTARSYAAGTALQLKISGNSFYIDQKSDVGNAGVIFEGVQDQTGPLVNASMFVQPGTIVNVPFANIFIENTAQAGKVLRILYGTDVDFKPALSAQVTLSGAVNATPYGMPYGASYAKTNTLAANTPEAVFPPGANVNGAVVWSASAFTRTGAIFHTNYLAKASAPVNATDGDPITQAIYGEASTDIWVNHTLASPVLVPAGKGLYFISDVAEVAAQRNVLYTLL